MSTVLFQTMPPLSPDEYAQLESSCLEHGIQVPIIVDENGTVIDGHHRQKIAQEHGIYLPTETRDTLTDPEKTTLSISLNIDRRQLSREQRRAIIAASLRADPNLSDRGHAARTGVDHKTVGAVRRNLDQVGNFPTSEQVDSFTTSPDPTATLADIPEAFEHEGITVTAAGEVIEPSVTEHTVTEKVKTVTGLDGKTYAKPAPKTERRRSLVDDAYKARADLWKAIESIRTISNDDRFTRNKADILAALQPSADLAIEILTDLFNNSKEEK